MFILTQDKVTLNVHISAIAAGVSIACCGAVLAISLWIWTVRPARRHLDRLSFRLLLWSMVWEIIYDINYIAVSVSVLASSNNAACAVGIYFMIGTLGVVNYLCTAIAVNLAITIVLGLNPIMLKLERWYIGVSLFVGLFVPIVPAALGHYGWDPIYNVCWIQAADRDTRVRNFVLDLYLWQLLSCAIATVAVAATLVKLFRQGRATSRALFEGNSMNLELSGNSYEHAEREKHSHGLIGRVIRRRRHSHDHEKMYGHLEDRFIQIALRISTYPIALIIVNGIIAIGDLYISVQDGVHTNTVYGLYCIYYFLYGARGIFFAALAIFVDPCLQKGMQAAWEATFRSKPQAAPPVAFKDPFFGSTIPPIATPHASMVNGESSCPPGTPGNSLQLASTQVDATPTFPAAAKLSDTTEGGDDESGDGDGDDGGMDVLQALFMSEPEDDHDHWTHDYHSHLPSGEVDLEAGPRRRSSGFKHPLRFLRRHLHHETDEGADAEPEGFTMTFAGVRADGLPAGMDDHADDVVLPAVLEAVEESNRIEQARSRSAKGSPAPTRDNSRIPTPQRRGSFAVAFNPMRRASLAYPPPVATAPRDNRGNTTPASALSPQEEQRQNERRQRRDRALEIAQKLYEDMEAQL